MIGGVSIACVVSPGYLQLLHVQSVDLRERAEMDVLFRAARYAPG